ncbi:sensor histidine kinase [Leucobacter luti]|uniref:sensor histidine kinase n=1 Tax=Leucobacter luti TaxID=340320 RepID=UPI003D016939
MRLTVIYSLLLLLVVALFGIGVAWYAAAAFDLELPESSLSEEAIDRANATLRTGLLVCFSVLLLFVPFISYVLARSTLAPVRRNMEAQQQFIDDASHELRTPIAVAQGELELALLNPREPVEYRAAIARALAALGELGSLTSGLLLLTSTERAAAIGSPVDVRDAAERAMLAMPQEIRERVHLEVTGRAEITGAAELLVRAIANLVENAGKFSPAGTPIAVVVERSGDEVRVVVSDEGPGMAAEQAAAAFDRFWRADSSRTLPGHGIGLSIVRRIAELHGGSAMLRSKPGRGTQAILELPARP